MAHSPHYETKQAILEEAGLSQVVQAEVLNGSADGTNVVFTTNYGPISDSNDDDVVDQSDVTAYVNGAPVAVSAVSGRTITLAAPPAANAVVTADYRYSNVTDAYLEKIRDEAESWIDDAMDAIDPVPYGGGTPSTNTTVPPTVRKLTRWYAAAQLLQRDYGMNHDTAQTSKDGIDKMTRAEEALATYIEIGGATGLSDVSAAEVDVYSEPDLFSTYDSTSGYISRDDEFMRDYGVIEDPPGPF